MPDFDEQRARVAAMRASCRKSGDDLYRAMVARQDVVRQLQRAAQKQTIPTARVNAGALQEQLRRLDALIAELNGAIAGCGQGLGTAVGELYEDPHPRSAVSHLDDRIPFLLLPVRMETVFVPPVVGAATGGGELWVRVY